VHLSPAKTGLQLISKYPPAGWSDRAQNLLFLAQQDIPMYGTAVE
jgi:hypothetical protein